MTRYALSTATPVLSRPDGTVQVGWDPRRAVVVHPPAGLPAGVLADLLRALQPYAAAQLAGGVPLRHIGRHILGLFHGQPGGRAYRQVLSEGTHLPGAGWDLVERAIAATVRGAVAA